MKITTFLNSKKTAKLLSYLVIIAGVFLFIMFGVLKWPGLHIDSSLYTTPIINLAQGNGWRFDAYTRVLVNRDSQEYSFHGVLYPIIFGMLLKISTYENLLLWSGIFNAITFIVYTFLFHRALNTKFPIWSLLISALFGAMAGVINQELQGRPEHLAPLLIAIPLLMREFKITHKYSRYCSYIIAGLLFILSPVIGIIYGMGLLFWLSLNYKKNLIKELLLAGLLSLAISGLIITIFCPFSPLQWIHNVFLAGNSGLMPNFSTALINTNLLLLSGFPAWNFLVVIMILFVFKTLWQQKLFIVLFIWGILGFYLWPKLPYYSYLCFFPLLLLMISIKHNDWITQNENRKNWLTLGSITFASLYFLTLIRWTLLLIVFWQQGLSYKAAKDTLQQFLNTLDTNKESIGYPEFYRPSFIVFENAGKSFIALEIVSDDDKTDPLLKVYEQKFHKQITYIIIPELGQFNEPPPSTNQGKFKLVYNGWTQKRAKFMGIKLGGTVPGYQFALYKRVK